MIDSIDMITVDSIKYERKYNTMFHNQTVRINRDLKSTCIMALALKNTELAESWKKPINEFNE